MPALKYELEQSYFKSETHIEIKKYNSSEKKSLVDRLNSSGRQDIIQKYHLEDIYHMLHDIESDDNITKSVSGIAINFRDMVTIYIELDNNNKPIACFNFDTYRNSRDNEVANITKMDILNEIMAYEAQKKSRWMIYSGLFLLGAVSTYFLVDYFKIK